MGQWMAVITFSNYPPVEAQLANLTTSHAFGWGNGHVFWLHSV